MSALPPKVYGALCKLKDIEHKSYLAEVVMDAAGEVPDNRWMAELCPCCVWRDNCQDRGCAILREAAVIDMVR